MRHQQDCSDCNHPVSENDPYFATPCGTFCSNCMEAKHSKECGVCASEFDLSAKHCEGCGGTGIRLNQHGIIERCDTCDQYESDWHAWMAAFPTVQEMTEACDKCSEIVPQSEVDWVAMREANTERIICKACARAK